MIQFLTQLVNGVALGAGYALLAVGWTVLLSAARLVNFSHGQMYMIGAFVTWWCMSSLGLPYFIAVPIALVVVGLVGFVLYVMMRKLVIGQNLVNLMLVTLAFGYLITGGSSILFGGNPQQIASESMKQRLYVLNTYVTMQEVLIVIAAVALYAITWFVLEKTRVGRMVRGVAEDPFLARLYGIDPAKVYAGVFVFSVASAALAGALIGPRHPILTSMGFEEVIITFLVVVLGGIGSIIGGLVAGIGLGLFIALFGAYVSPAYAMAAAFAVMLVILVVRPQGLKVRA
ncbi:branched-chain amino acid transport system permease protein [Microbacterium sp. W4I4]|uniref:branched-chain amino acid ABC transporter permease n=1 Tax=Microbacterium sp. W4I4 TaxID=3042295 RepID=UPI00277D49B5|nr:branched-chain amino acid ABC transporter permease [Microbacterium sp. W4I4]MDQ0614284.1 branched-chain amino acid transport system permease protein [Microbacterium sp. W4I4]